MLGGVLYGAVAWTAYSAAELALSIWWPLTGGSDVVYTSHQMAAAATTLVVFVFLGGTAGGLGSVALGLLPRGGRSLLEPCGSLRLRALGTGTLALAYAAHQAGLRPLGKADAFNLLVSIGLAVVAGAVASQAGARWSAHAAFLCNPWAASLLLLGGGWVGRYALHSAPAILQFGAAVGLLLVIGCAAAIGSAVLSHRRSHKDSLLPVRHALALAGALVVVLGLPAVARRSWRLPPRRAAVKVQGPNVILITLDTVRADHLSVGGYSRDTTPFLVALAGQATLYSQAFATSDITLTSHASIFTGQYGSWHGAYLAPPGFPVGRPLGDSCPTLAGVLADHGFRTLAVVANYGFLDPAFGLNRGFQLYELVGAPFLDDRSFLGTGALHLARMVTGQTDLGPGDIFPQAADVNEAALRLLRQAKRDGAPFLLFLNYMDAHVPYVPPPPFKSLFPGSSHPVRTEAYASMRREVMSNARPMSPDEKAYFVSQYDGAIRYLDAQLSDLVAQLKGLGLFDGTMLIITSDHGEAFGEMNLVGHPGSVYQDQIGIPLLIKYPHQERPSHVSAPVSLVDVMPTVLSVLGIEVPPGVQGKPLDCWTGAPRRPIVSESFASGGYHGRFARIERAVVWGDMKLIESTAGERGLFDLARDPDETHDLFHQEAGEAKALASLLDAWASAIPKGTTTAPSVDQETVKRLRALGYLN